MRFLLSIHDVWPGNFPLVAAYLSRLRSMAQVPVALLVVPEYHGRTPLGQSGEFLDWLRQEAAGGTEIFLHGFRHWMPELAEGIGFTGKRSGWGNWINRRWVAGEAEFCGLAPVDQNRLLALGVQAFRACGLAPAGFVAPTWHGSPSAGALRDHGLRIRETRFRVEDLDSGAWLFAPPLAWDLTRGGAPALFGGQAWLWAVTSLPLLKVAIHPGDFAGSSALRIIEGILRKGEGSSYAGLFQRGPH